MPGKAPMKSQMADAPDIETNKIDETTPLKGAELAPVALSQKPLRWLRTLSQSYSWRLLVMVSITSHMLKGFVAGGGDEGLVGKPAEFILAQLGAGAGRLQVLKAASMAPWALKPVVALLSDTTPIYGYKKMPYVVIVTVLAILAAITLGTGVAATTTTVVLCLFVCFLQAATVDVLVVAKQSEEVKQRAGLGPEFMTFTWLGINFAQLASVAVIGPLITYAGPRIPYLVAAPLMALVLWPTLGNFLGERTVSAEERSSGMALVRQHPALFGLTLLIGALVLTLIGVTIFADGAQSKLQQYVALGASSIVLTAVSSLLRWDIAGPVVFYFLLGLISFQLDGALFYFYTDSLKAYPAGPHFSTFFYTTCIGAATFLGFLIGYLTGAELFRDWSYRGILRATISLRAVTQLAMVPFLLRWTTAIGIPDSIFVLTQVALDSTFFAWRWIPKQVMSAHLTPKGVEATTLGLIAGTFNMATILSSYLGSHVMKELNIAPKGADAETAAFANLWRAQIMAAIVPLSMLLLIPLFIPAKCQTEPLLTECPDSAVHNSVFEQVHSALRRRGAAQDLLHSANGGEQ